jgi:hypothetical protein
MRTIQVIIQPVPQIAQERPAVEEKVDTPYVSREAFKLFTDELKESIASFVQGMKILNANQVEMAKGMEAVNRNVTQLQKTLDEINECDCENCECDCCCEVEEQPALPAMTPQQEVVNLIQNDPFFKSFFGFVNELEKTQIK